MDFTTLPWVPLLLGSGLGALITLPILLSYRSKLIKLDAELNVSNNLLTDKGSQIKELQSLLTESRELATHYRSKCEQLEKQTEQLTQYWQQAQQETRQTQQEAQELEIELHGVRNTLEMKEQAYKAQLQHLESTKEQLKKEFSLLANQIFEEKSAKFTNLSQQSIEQLLKPVQGELKGFRDKMEAIHSEDLKQRAALKQELLHLQANSQAITEQAHRLTTALQGQKKTQGNWGELMLENVLDSAGLRLGEDYEREVHFTTSEGNYRPDVIVHLPQGRHLVIDAKTSFNAYTRYVNAENELEAQHALHAHVQAVSARINELADKMYQNLPGLNSPEVVILFMPIESAFVEALKYEPTLYQQALERHVLVATPTTLLTSLNIVKQLWRFEAQSHYARELAQRAERFYNKLNAFLNSMEGVGKQLDKAKESYEKAFAQLYMGKGNLIKQAAEFKELGVSVSKELPQDTLDKAKLELEP